MSNVERISRIAAELNTEVVVVEEGSWGEILYAHTGGGGYIFRDDIIVVMEGQVADFTDEEVRFLIAHEMGHRAHKDGHLAVMELVGHRKASFKAMARIELEADSYAIAAIGGGRMAGISVLLKASRNVIAPLPVVIRPVIWAIQLIAQIIPRAINIALA